MLTDTQIMTLAVAIIIPTAAVIYSRSSITDVQKRIDDLKDSMNKRLDDSSQRMDDMKTDIRADIKSLGDRMETLLKIHVLEHHK